VTARYSIVTETRGDVEVFTLRNASGAFAEVAPQFGNNCFSFSSQRPVLEPVNFEDFYKRPTSYGIPILFPFPNRIKDGTFPFRGKQYQVDPPRHGFVRDKRWVVVGTGADDEEGAWIRCSIDASDYADQILNQFPFPFRFEVTYRLKDSKLEMGTTVRNTGTADLPFGFGIHPYFRKPERGTLQVKARKYWELIETLPTGKLLDVKGQFDLQQPADVNGLQLDDIFTDLVTDSDGFIRCVLADHNNGTQTIVDFDGRQFPNVVLFTPPAPRQAICIEPYTCPTDAFNLYNRGIESNVIALPPGEEMHFKITFYSLPIRQM